MLPRADGKYGTASELRIARAQDVRDLFGPKQLRSLLQVDQNIYWLTPDITADRAPELRNYLMRELEDPELTRLDKLLLQVSKPLQRSRATVGLSAFIGCSTRSRPWYAAPPSKWRWCAEDGTHVAPMRDGLPQAFLPTSEKTGFPTVRGSVCKAPAALEFLKALGLTEPDLADDVIRNLLPGYRGDTIDTNSYDEDIARIFRAYQTD